MQDDMMPIIRRRPWSLLRKLNLVICVAVVLIALATIIFPIGIWVLEIALLIFIPWMIGNMIYEHRKMRQFKAEAAAMEARWQAANLGDHQ